MATYLVDFGVLPRWQWSRLLPPGAAVDLGTRGMARKVVILPSVGA